jgi:hypothetical protein
VATAEPVAAPDERLLPRYSGGDGLGAPRPCRDCGATVRQSIPGGWFQGRFLYEGPVPTHWVSPTWPASWWHPTWGLIDRVTGSEPNHPDEQLCPYHICTPTTDAAPTPRKAHMTNPNPFGTPAPPGANGPSTEDLKGKLLLINVASIEEIKGTIHGDAKAVKCSVVELDGPDAGAEHPDCLLFSKTLTQQLATPQMYLGRLSKDPIPGGKTAWHFNGAETDPAAVATAQQYLAYKAGQAPPTPPPAASAPAFTPPPAATPAAPAASAAPPWAAAS